MVTVEKWKGERKDGGGKWPECYGTGGTRWHQKQEPADFSHSGRDSGIQGLAVTSDHAL